MVNAAKSALIMLSNLQQMQLKLEITEVVLVYCNIVNNDCQQDSTVLHHA